MAAKREKTRRRIVEAAYQAFYEGGFDRSGVDAIAEAAGITKRTLYDHFASKDLLIAAVLDHQNELVLAGLQRWADKQADSPGSFAAQLFDDLDTWVLSAEPWLGSGFTRAAMELACLPGHPARAAASNHKRAVENRISERLSALGDAEHVGHAKVLMILLEGAMALCLIHQSAEPIAAARKSAIAIF